MKSSNKIVFALSSSKKLGEAVAKRLNCKLGDITIKHFADGETMVKANESLRGKDVYVIQSTSKPVNESLMELLIAIDSFKRSSAKTITVFTPYFGYSRQDRKSESREPITCKLVSKLIEAAGATRITIVDLHALQTQGFFEIPTDTVSAFFLLLDAVKANRSFKNTVIVSPDYGSVKRASQISKLTGLPMAILDKRRPAPNIAEITNVLGNVKGKRCIIFDDMIDTGGTLVAACKALKNAGALSIECVATHGLFSRDAAERFNQALKEKTISKLYVSNTLDSVYECGIKGIKIVDISPLISELIKIYEGTGFKSISELYKNSIKGK